MILQVQSDPIIQGAISANWVLAGAFIVIGFLLVAFMSYVSSKNAEAMNSIKEEIRNIHVRINTREEEHDELEDKHVSLSSKVSIIEAHQKDHAENIANIIINKMYAASPPGKIK